ncbi:MAG: TolC family protein [Acidobacteria bacterium]|nr:MAG: TolC family protein [Acidobacteriota bacterium]
MNLILWLALAGVPAQSAPLDLATLEAQALQRHPAIRAAAAEVDAAKARAKQAGAWVNPVIGASADELRPREQPSGVFGGFIQQTIPLGGKLSAAKGVAASQVGEAEARLAESRQRVLFDVRQRYYALVVAEERLSVAKELAALAARTVEMTRQLINVGIADRPDQLGADAEAARMQARLAEAQTFRLAAWQRLGAAIADPALAPQPLAQSVSEALPVLDRADTLARVLAESGAVASADGALAVQKSLVTSEKAAVRPDLFVRGDAGGNRERADGRAIGPQFGVEAGVSIPLFNRNQGGIASATSLAIGAAASAEAVRLDVTAAFASAFAEYESARALAESYRAEILPKARLAYELHLAKYQEMVAAYPPVLQSERSLFSMTEDYLAALDRAWTAVSALRTAMAVR